MSAAENGTAASPSAASEVDRTSRQGVYQSTIRYFLSAISSLLDDEEVSEIMINGPKAIFYEKHGKIHRSDLTFSDERVLLAAARNIGEFVNRYVGGDNHSMDARLPDGSRVHVIVPPSSRGGTCISIRRFRQSTMRLENLVLFGSISEEAKEFLELAVVIHKNIVIAGGTGTGKTSLLNALSAAIPADERIIVIEDSSELQLNQPHTIYLEAQPPRPDGGGLVSIRDLFVDSLRMRPDRIIVGEVRRGEALDLVQSMISGHAGSLTTVHASSARDAAVRLETLSMMSDVGLPVYVARAQVASAIQCLVQIRRFPDGSRKVEAITECLGLNDRNEYVFQDLYRFQASGKSAGGRITGQLNWTGTTPSFADEPARLGYQERINLTSALFSKVPHDRAEADGPPASL